MVRTTMLRLMPAVACSAGIVLAAAGPAWAAADPPGNNGTVKIDGIEFDDHPNNEPHVGCEFQVDFYGFDEGDLDATVTFEAIPPTVPDGTVPPGAGAELLTDELAIGEDEAGGGTDLDASRTYDLTEELQGIEAHPLQGWHVRLVVHAEGSQGADTKFKVFWVTGCGGPATTTTTGPGSTTTSPPGSGSTTTSSSTPGGPGGPHDTTTTSPGGVAPGPDSPGGSRATSASTTTVSVSQGLAETGSNTLPLVVGGLLLLALGGAGVVIAHRVRLTAS